MTRECVDPEGSESAKDLLGLICPHPIAIIVQNVHGMAVGETIRFLVDDPLALKAIPEELDEYGDLQIAVREHHGHWEILVTRVAEQATGT